MLASSFRLTHSHPSPSPFYSIRGLEFKRFERILNRLVRARHACEVATDVESAQRITDLITPFTTPNESKAKAEAIVAKIKRLSAPDSQGRTCTTGTRKKARAQVWMQYTPALAALFHNPAEKDRIAKRAHTLEVAKAKEEARQVALKEAGAKSLGPVFRELDLQEARKKKERQRAGLDPGPSSPLVVSPIEKVWAAEVEKRERIEKLAREMLKEKKRKELAEADLALSSSSSSSPGEGDTSHMTDDQIREARIIASDLAKLPSSPFYHHHIHASLPTPLPTDPPRAYLPPTAFETYKSIVTKDLEDLQALKDSRSKVLTPANSNSPERDPAQPKDGTIVVTNTTVVEPASDPTIGQILVNGTPIHRYFPDPKDREIILRPLKVSRLLGAFNIFVIAHRGGTTGTAGAIALAIAKGVAIHQPTAKQALARGEFIINFIFFLSSCLVGRRSD